MSLDDDWKTNVIHLHYWSLSPIYIRDLGDVGAFETRHISDIFSINIPLWTDIYIYMNISVHEMTYNSWPVLVNGPLSDVWKLILNAFTGINHLVLDMLWTQKC